MKNKKTAGLTLTEMLCCVVIMLLVSIGMVNGVSLAVRNYERSLMVSESQVLCSTLTSMVSDELRYAGPVDWDKDPISFFSRNYGQECAFYQNGEHQVTLKPVEAQINEEGIKLLPGRAYHFGMRAKVTLAQKQGTEKTFLVNVCITDSQDRKLVENDFEVEKLNRDVDPTTP